MRSQCGNRFAGEGTRLAFYESEGNALLQTDHRVHVNLPYDRLNNKERESLHGEVITYHIDDLDDLNNKE